MVIDLTATLIIQRDLSEVAEYAMDPRHDSEWIGGIVDAEILSEGEFGVGTRATRVAGFMGRRFEYVNVIVEYEPPKRLVKNMVQGPFPMRTTFTCTAKNAKGSTVCSFSQFRADKCASRKSAAIQIMV